jgi:hypothetical protein
MVLSYQFFCILGATVYKNQSDFDKAFEGVEDLIVDCTEIPVQRPDNQDVQKEHYSGKKTTYSKTTDD